MATQPAITEQEPLNVSPFEGDDAPPPAPTPPPEKEAPEPAPEKPAPKDDLSDIRRELAELRRTNAELSASERYWAGKARGGREEGNGRQEEPEVDLGDLSAAQDPDGQAPTPAKFIDDLTERGPEAIIAELKRRGLVMTKDQAVQIAAETTKRIVQHERGKMSVEDKISRDFPELKDESSELFQTTRQIYREHVNADPALAKSPSALLMAASLAKLQLQAKAPPKKPARDYREAEEDGDKESVNDRRRRIASQQGDLGRSSGAPFEGDDDDLGPEHREVLNMFARAGVTEADYRAQRAKDRRRA